MNIGRGSVFFAAALLAGLSAFGDVVINEVQSANDKTLTIQIAKVSAVGGKVDDEPDWVELYNNGDTAVDLSGWGFSDKASKPFKYEFPKGATIAAGGYLLLIADEREQSEDATTGAPTRYHIPISLSTDGETLILTSKDSSYSHTVTFGMLPCDTSCGFDSDGTPIYYATPTPEAANSAQTYSAPLAPVTFSQQRGLFTTGQEFDLTLSHEDPDAQIYYTTDHSDPDDTTGAYGTRTRYTGPIHISGTTVVRATAEKAGSLPYRNVTSHSYIYPDQVMQQEKPACAGDKWSDFTKEHMSWCPSGEGWCYASYKPSANVITDTETLAQFVASINSAPVVSVTMSDYAMFDPTTGLHSRPSQYNGKPEGERPASVEWVSGDSVFGLNAGLKMQGGWGRYFDMTSKKSFQIKFRKKYGKSKLQEDILAESGCPRKKFMSVILRAESHDSWTEAFTDTQTMGNSMKDEFWRELSLPLLGYAVHGSYIHLYINGLYWGLYNITEHADEELAAEIGGGEGDDYVMLKNSTGDVMGHCDVKQYSDYAMTLWNAGQEYYDQGKSEAEAFQGDADMTIKASYEKAEAFFDIENLIRYMHLGYISGNWDWPQNNWNVFGIPRATPSVPFRWMVWDFETTFESVNADNSKKKDNLYSGSFTGNPGGITKVLLRSPEFKQRFADLFDELTKDGGVLSTANMLSRYQDLATRVRPRIFAESARWGAYWHDYDPTGTGTYTKIFGLDAWDAEYNRVTTQVLPQRVEVVRQQFKNLGVYPQNAKPATATLAGDGKSLTLSLAEQAVNAAPKRMLLAATPAADTIYYTTDGSDPCDVWASGDAQAVGTAYAGETITSPVNAVVKARVLTADGEWSTLTTANLKGTESDSWYEFLPTGNGENWFVPENWSKGEVPNAADAQVRIGVPTAVKSGKGWRNVHLDQNATVGTLVFTCGGWTNRLDDAGNLTLGGAGAAATVQVADSSGAGLAMLDLDGKVTFANDVTFDVANPAGDAGYGAFWAQGELDGNGKALVKTGAGKMSFGFAGATNEQALGSIAVNAGTLAIYKRVTVTGAITGAAGTTLELEINKDGDAGDTAIRDVTCATLDVPAVRLFLKSNESGTYVGGCHAADLPTLDKVTVYVRDDENGTVAFKDNLYSPVDNPDLRIVNVDGKKTYQVIYDNPDNPDDPPVPPQPKEPVFPEGDDWGYTKEVAIAGTDYMVVVFTNTSKTLSMTLPSNVSQIDYLVVGGGGAGGRMMNATSCGGGGAGEVVEGAVSGIANGTTLSISVGAGGAASSVDALGADGVNSTLTVGEDEPIVALKGAGGGANSAGRGNATDYACGGGGGATTNKDQPGGVGKVSNGGKSHDVKKGGGGGGAGGNGYDYNAAAVDGVAYAHRGGPGVGVTIFEGVCAEYPYYVAGGGSGSWGNRQQNYGSLTGGGGAGSFADNTYGGPSAQSGSRWGAGGGGMSGDATGRVSGAGHQGVVVVRYALGAAPQPQSSGSVLLTCSNYQGSTTLTDFPMLVRISPTAIPGFSYDGLTSSQISFKDSNGNELPCEVDTWNPSGESLVWVKVPSLTATTTVTLCWGKERTTESADVWSEYLRVCHLNGDLTDATGNGTIVFDGADSSKMNFTSPNASQFGSGVMLAANAAGSLLDGGDTKESFSAEKGATLSGWYRVDEWTGTVENAKILGWGNWNGDTWGGFYLQTKGSENIETVSLKASSTGSASEIENFTRSGLMNGLHHVAVTYGPSPSGDTSRGWVVWLDGVEVKRSNYTEMTDSTSPIVLMGNLSYVRYLDEFRASDDIKSSDWVLADYQQQATAEGLLYKVGTQLPAVEGREITNVSVSDTTVTVDLGPANNDVSLWVAGAPTDLGEDFENWTTAAGAERIFVEVVAKGGAVHREYPNVFALSPDVKVVRFFTRPAYDATLSGLQGAGTAQKVGPYIDTEFTPHLKNNKVVIDFTPGGFKTEYAQAVATARRTWDSGERMAVFLSTEGKIRVDYQKQGGAPASGQINADKWKEGTDYVATFDGGNSSVTLKGLFNNVEDTKSYTDQIDQSASDSLLVFATHSGSEIDNIATSHVTVHDVCVYGENGEVVHNYIPVTLAGTNTLYDAVEGKLLSVSKEGGGASNFVAGEVTSTVTGALTVSAPVMPGERTITSATLTPGTSDCVVEFSPAGVGAKKVKVWAVADVTDMGTDGTNVWSKTALVDILETTEDSKTFTIPNEWLVSGVKTLRFLTTPVYDATLEGLQGNRSAADIGPYINTGYKPNLTDKLVADLTTKKDAYLGNEYETVFSARKNNMASDKSMTVFICHQTTGTPASAYVKRFRFDYGTYNTANPPEVSILASDFQWSLNAPYEVVLDGNMASVTGEMNPTAVNNASAESGDAGDTLLLFAARAESSHVITTNHVGKFTLHSFQWSDSTGKLLHDYIPVVADGVNTLYDTVGDEVMTVLKAGTGAGGFGAEGTPTPVEPITWSQTVSVDVPPVEKDLRYCTVTCRVSLFNGYAQSPVLTVKDGTTTLHEGTDYTYTVSDGDGTTRTNAGTYTITLNGAGEYTGSKTANWEIEAAVIDKVTLAATSAEADGQSHQPVVVSITSYAGVVIPANAPAWGDSVAITYSRNGEEMTDFTTPGLITVTASPKSGSANCTGSASATFAITSDGPIKVYRLGTGGTETYLGGFSLVSTAVAVAEADTDGTSYKILVTGGTAGTQAVYAEEETTVYSSSSSVIGGTLIPTTKSLQIVGDGSPTYNVLSTYQSVLSNCWFLCSSTASGDARENISFSNIALVGKSLVAPCTVKGKNQSGDNTWGPKRQDYGLGALTFENCYLYVSNTGLTKIFGNQFYTENAIVAFESNMGGGQATDSLTFRSCYVNVPGGARWISARPVLKHVLICDNQLGTEDIPFGESSSFFFTAQMQLDADITFVRNTCFFPENTTNLRCLYLHQQNQNLHEGTGPVKVVVADNDLRVQGWNADTLVQKQAKLVVKENNANTYYDITATNNHVNGYCYNYLAENQTSGSVDTYIMHAQAGHDADAINSLPTGLEVVDSAFYGNKVSTGTESDVTTTRTMAADECCTNCCVLGYCVTLDPNGGTWPDTTTTTKAQTFPTLFRDEPLAHGPLMLAAAELPTREGTPAMRWKDAATGTTYTSAQLAEGVTVTKSMTLTADYSTGPLVYIVDDDARGTKDVDYSYTSIREALADLNAKGIFKQDSDVTLFLRPGNYGQGVSQQTEVEGKGTFETGEILSVNWNGRLTIAATNEYGATAFVPPSRDDAASFASNIQNMWLELRPVQPTDGNPLHGASIIFENVKFTENSAIVGKFSGYELFNEVGLDTCYVDVNPTTGYYSAYATPKEKGYYCAKYGTGFVTYWYDAFLAASKGNTVPTALLRLENSTLIHNASQGGSYRFVAGGMAPISVIVNGCVLGCEAKPAGYAFLNFQTCPRMANYGSEQYPRLYEIADCRGYIKDTEAIYSVLSDGLGNNGVLKVHGNELIWAPNVESYPTGGFVSLYAYCSTYSQTPDTAKFYCWNNTINGYCYNNVIGYDTTAYDSNVTKCYQDGHTPAFLADVPAGYTKDLTNPNLVTRAQAFTYDPSSIGTPTLPTYDPAQDVPDTQYCEHCDKIGFNVTFDANGGTPTPDPQFVAKQFRDVTYLDAKATEPTGVTKGGAAPSAWVVEGTGAKWNFADAVTGSMTLKAVYTVTVTFNANGGTVTPASKEVVPGEPYGELPTPTYTDHTFTGWYKSGSDTPVTKDDTVTEAHTLVAHWTQDMSITATSYDGIYDQKAHSITLTGVPDGAKVSCRASNKDDWVETELNPDGTLIKLTRTNVTSTPVHCMIEADGRTTTYVDSTITIAEAPIESVTLKSSGVTYDGLAHQPEVDHVTANGNSIKLSGLTTWTVTYSRTGDFTDEVTDFTSAGTIWVKVVGTHNVTGQATAQFTIGKCSLEDCTAMFESDWWYPNRSPEYKPTQVTVKVTSSGAQVYRGLVGDLFTCTIYTNATKVGESYETVRVASRTYYATLTAKEGGNFSGTTPVAAKWELKRVNYTVTDTGDKTWTGLGWDVETPANYIADAGQTYPDSTRESCGHYAGITSGGAPLSVAVNGDFCVDQLQLSGDVTLVGDPDATTDTIQSRAWSFAAGTAAKRNTYVLRDVEINGSSGDRFNLNEDFTTVVIEGTNTAHSGCIWQFSGNDKPKRVELVFRNGATTLESTIYSYAGNNTLGITNAIAFTNATLRAPFTGSSLFAYDVSFKLGELNKSVAEDAAAAVWSGGSIYLAPSSSLTVDATEKGAGTYRLVKASENALTTKTDGLGWPDAIEKATIKVAPNYRAKLVLSSDGKALDLVIFHKGLILFFGPAN